MGYTRSVAFIDPITTATFNPLRPTGFNAEEGSRRGFGFSLKIDKSLPRSGHH